ncbi:MAG: cytochrome c biogenesis CcdA family protein [Methanobacteriota archaeon]
MAAAAVLVAAGLVAYAGYEVGFLRAIPTIMEPGGATVAGAVSLAFVVGVAAFFSPCAFPLLPAYVSYVVAAGAGERRTARFLRLGAAAAAGLLLVVLGAGVIVAVLRAQAPFQPDPRQDPAWLLGIRVAAGLAVAMLGLGMLLGRAGWLTRRFHALQPKTGTPDPDTSASGRAMFAYGFLYSAAGIGCTGPLLLALMLYAFTFPEPAVALIAFAVAAFTMALLMIGVTMAVGLARKGLVRRLVAAGPSMQRIAGGVALVVGLWTAYSVTAGIDVFVRTFFPFLPQ